MVYGCVWKCCVPHFPNGFADHYPVLHGYFIGNIPYFQTNPYVQWYIEYEY